MIMPKVLVVLLILVQVNFGLSQDTCFDYKSCMSTCVESCNKNARGTREVGQGLPGKVGPRGEMGPPGAQGEKGDVGGCILEDRIQQLETSLEELKCFTNPQHLGLKSGTIPDSALTASSVVLNDASYLAKYGRLDQTEAGGSWEGGKNEGEWLQVTFENVTLVAGVITQGRYSSDRWAKTFHVEYLNVDDEWETISEGGTTKIFTGNNDQNTWKINKFKEILRVKAVKVVVETYYEFPAIRMEILGCRGQV